MEDSNTWIDKLTGCLLRDRVLQQAFCICSRLYFVLLRSMRPAGLRAAQLDELKGRFTDVAVFRHGNWPGALYESFQSGSHVLAADEMPTIACSMSYHHHPRDFDVVLSTECTPSFDASSHRLARQESSLLAASGDQGRSKQPHESLRCLDPELGPAYSSAKGQVNLKLHCGHPSMEVLKVSKGDPG